MTSALSATDCDAAFFGRCGEFGYLRHLLLRWDKLSPDRAESDALEMICYLAEHRGEELSPRSAILRRWAEERGDGQPLAHVMGRTRFLGRWFALDRCVHAPHPATALLACLCLETLRRAEPPRHGLEIGVGAGAIAITLAAELPGLRMSASDISRPALRWTSHNAVRLLGNGADRVVGIAVDDPDEILSPFRPSLPGLADFLISNPPYLERGDEISTEYRRHMPTEALYGYGGDPLHVYRRVARGAKTVLRPGGHIFFECRRSRMSDVAMLFEQEGITARCLTRDEVVALCAAEDLARLSNHDRSRRFDNHGYVIGVIP